jgi:hypothetical protein
MRGLVIAVAVLGCRAQPPPPAAPPPDAGARPGEVAIPLPAAAAGDVVTWRREGTLDVRGRMFHKDRFRGNVTWTGTRASEIRVETLAVEAGRPSRLRLTYTAHATVARTGGLERALGPALEGRSYLVEIVAGEPRVSAEGGAAAGDAEVERVALDVRDLDLRWRPVQGQTLVIGAAVAGPSPLVLRSARGGAARVATRGRGNLAVGLGAPIEADLDLEAAIDLATGRVREVRDGGVASLSRARVEGVKDAELGGTAEWTSVATNRGVEQQVDRSNRSNN